MPSIFHHINTAKHVLDHIKFRKTELAVEFALIGSVIVDLENLGVINNVHGRSRGFLKYLQKHDPKYVPLAVGMVIHELTDQEVEPAYVHKNEAKALRYLKKHDPFSVNLPHAGHIFLEHCIDCSLVEEKPELVDLITKVRKKITQRHLTKIAFHLARFFDGDLRTVLSSLKHFKNYDLEQFRTHQGASAVWSNYMFLYSQKDLLKRKPSGIIGSFLTNLKLVWAYLSFYWNTKQQKIEDMIHKAKREFSDHFPVMRQARRKILRRFHRSHKLKVAARGHAH